MFRELYLPSLSDEDIDNLQKDSNQLEEFKAKTFDTQLLSDDEILSFIEEEKNKRPYS